MTRIFTKDTQSRLTRYGTAFVDVTDFEIGVQAFANATKNGGYITVSDVWAGVKTKDGLALPGKYKIISEQKKGNISIIVAEKY